MMKHNLLGPTAAVHVQYLTDVDNFSSAEKAILLSCLQGHYQECTHRMANLLGEVDEQGKHVQFISSIIAQYYYKTNTYVPATLICIASNDTAHDKMMYAPLKLWLLQIDKGFKEIPDNEISEKVQRKADRESSKWLSLYPKSTEDEQNYFRLATLGNQLHRNGEYIIAHKMYTLAKELEVSHNIIDEHKAKNCQFMAEAYSVGERLYKYNVRLSSDMNDILNQIHQVPSEYSQARIKPRQKPKSKTNKSVIESPSLTKHPKVTIRGDRLELSNLSHLDFYSQFTGIDEVSIEGIIITDAILEERPIPVEFFQQFAHVPSWTFRNCSLTTLNGIHHLTQLTNILISELLIPIEAKPTLDLSPLAAHQDIATVQATHGHYLGVNHIIDNCTMITQINIHGGVDVRIDDHLWKLSNLRKAYFEKCDIKRISAPLHPTASVLKDISFRNNMLTAVPLEIFAFPRLERLDISFNKISHLPEGRSVHMDTIKLNISNNPL